MQDRVSSSEKKIVIFSLISCEFAGLRSGFGRCWAGKQSVVVDAFELPGELWE